MRTSFTDDGESTPFGPALEVLRQAAEREFRAAGIDPQHLILERHDHHVSIGAADAAVNVATADALLVDDLLSDPSTDSEGLRQMVQVIVGVPAVGPNDNDAVDDVNVADDDKSLTGIGIVEIENDTIQINGGNWVSRWRAVLAVETIRNARSLPAKIESWRTRRYSGSINDCQWPLIATGKSGSEIDVPMNFPQWMLRLARQNTASIVVDWQEAGLRGIGPRSRFLVDGTQSDFQAAVQDVVKENFLQVRRFGKDAWWVGPDAVYQKCRRELPTFH